MLKLYSLHDAILGRPALRDRGQADLHMTFSAPEPSDSD